MKKIAAGATATVFAVAGLSTMSIAPAVAAPFANCDDARAAGNTNIPVTSPYYSSDLDRNNDGVACEDETAGGGVIVEPVPPVAPQPPAADPEVGDVPHEGAWAWDNCSEAYAAGVSNIPAGSPGYGTHLDSDLDGIGCEVDGNDDAAFPYTVDQWEDTGEYGVIAPGNGTDHSQVEQVPAGGADTGVPVERPAMTPGLVGLSALALAAFAGSGLLLRRAVKG